MRKYLAKPLLSLISAVGLVAGLVAHPVSVGAQALNASDYPTAPRIPFEGRMYTVVQGAVYQVQDPLLLFIGQIYDPGYYAKHYQTYRVVDANTRYPVLSSMADGFENASTIRDLVTPARGFTSITLQSTMAPTVTEYVALRKYILNGGNFLDNRIEPSSAQAHSGTRSLRAYAVPAGGGTSVSKASLESELMHFLKGDEFRFSAWFYIAQGKPLGLLDLETSYVLEYPGIRILLDDNLRPRVELKWGDKPTYHSVAGTVLPVRRWFNLRLHAFLSDGVDGRIQMWVDGQQVIDADGQTLPMPDVVYDRMELGITANEASAAEVFVDDVTVGKQPAL